MNRISTVAWRGLATLAIQLACVASSFAATYFVDNQHAAANDVGSGTESSPYRTISAAVARRGGADHLIVVKAGTYHEQVTVNASGALGSPFVIHAQGAVTLECSEDYSSSSRWALVSGTTWLASSVTWQPNQVFVAGRRLAPTTLTTLPTNTFRWVLGAGLYVNVGGANPGLQDARVGRFDYGFRVIGRSHVVVRGFTVMRADIKAFYAEGSSDVVFENDRALASGGAGIHFSGAEAGRIENCESADNGDHGILLSMNTRGALVRGNRSHHNERVAARGANGIHLFSSPGNRLEANEAFDNQDSGFQINGDSHEVVCVNNRSWSNRDHGYDHLGSNDVVHVHSVAVDNVRDGFSFEGDSPGGKVYNSIAVNNGAGVSHYNLWVEEASQDGFESDYNVLWNANGQPPARWGAKEYASLSSFARDTDNENHGKQANPRFVNAGDGDFHLLAGSPAIDAASSSVPSWPSADAEGRARFDVAAVDNAGAGSVRFADRGAFEFAGGDFPPVAALSVTPSAGVEPLTVTANASSSTDRDGVIRSYRFDFGDGVVVGPQADATASHTYTVAATRVVEVLVTDDDGLSGGATVTVTAGSKTPDEAPIVTAPTSVSVNEGSRLTLRVSAVDPDGNAIASLSADLSQLPLGHNARFTAVDGTVGTLTWTPTYADSGTYSVTFRAGNGETGIATTTIHVNHVDRAPIVSAPLEIPASPGSPVRFQVTVRDPDGDAIRSLTASLDGAAGSSFTVFDSTQTRGSFTWVPGTSALENGKVGNYRPRFIARNALTGTIQTHIQVKLRSLGGDGGGDWRDDGAGRPTLAAIPATLALSVPHPNPSGGATTLGLDLPADAAVSLAIYDLQGREVWSESSRMTAGRRTLSWDGRHAAGGRAGAGVFYARVGVGGEVFIRRVVRL